jgi:opacity protein-like surface antigen
MKKIIIKSLLLSVIAANSAVAMNNGFYAGLGLGVADILTDVTYTDVDAFSTDRASIELGSTGPLGSLVLGYNFLFGEQFMLGLQLDGQISGVKNEITSYDSDIMYGNSSSSISQKYKHGFGLSARPGASFNDTTNGFLVLGYRNAKMDYTLNEIDSNFPPLNLTGSQNIHGFEFGLGGEVCLNDQLGLRLEVTQTQYQSKDLVTIAGAGSLGSKMKSNQALLSLIWYPNYM